VAQTAETAQSVDFEALVREGQHPLLRYLMARMSSAAEASELAQETFVRAYCALARGERPRRPIPWLLGIARHTLLEAVRNHRYERQLRERMGRMMGVEWQSPWHDRVERRLVVASALEGLSSELREPVLLHYFGGLSVAEVAGHLEITAGAVKTRLWRARQALRGELEVLMGDADAKATAFSLPRDLATRAKLIAERPPIYRSMSVGLHVGGPRWATAPMFEPLFSDDMLSVEDVRLAVERLHAARVAGDSLLAPKLELWPALEPFYHQDPVAVWSFLRSAEIGTEAFQDSEEGRLVITDGWRLGTQSDAPDLLSDFREAGLRHVWFTLAGLEQTHDDLCQRPGAFAAIVAAMKRCRDAGIETGSNIIVSTRSAGEVRELAMLVRSLGAERFVPTYPFVSTRPEHDHLQPEPDDLVGLPPEGLDVNWGYRDFWSDPAAFTEAALRERAIQAHANSEETAEDGEGRRALHLWVAPGLDLLINDSQPVPTQRLGNLRTDSAEQIHRVLAGLKWPPDPPSDAGLAERYGDPNSRKAFPGRWDTRNGLYIVRQKWLEAWRVDSGIARLPFPWAEDDM
jgi:RNA polymerase sigma-70 factor (ECF subfamily)